MGYNEVINFENQVWKATSLGADLSAKAYNARVITSWLASCLHIVQQRSVPEGRLCGLWVSENGQPWPDHELLLPSAVAMILIPFHWKIGCGLGLGMYVLDHPPSLS